ncbi:FHA domain-containing protein [Brachybacterium sp. AOP3-A1-3]|uniref:FHA domain-containing protein n=1 Tax=Brachybacterium sp. AOP3-A1-3 TaxID=3457699 RepID=UPI004033412F
MARETGWVVLVPGAPAELVEAGWSLLGEAPPAEGFVDELIAAAGLDSADAVTAILFAIFDGTTATLGVKGSTPLAVFTADGAQRIAGTEKGPFVVQAFQDVHRIAFGDLPPEKSLGAPRVVAGVARVRGFVHAVVDPASLDEEARAALAGQVEADGRSIEDPEETRRRTERAAPAAANPTNAAPATVNSTSAEERPAATDERPAVRPRPPAFADRGQDALHALHALHAVPGHGSFSTASVTAATDSDQPNVFDRLLVSPSSPAAAPVPEPAQDPPGQVPQGRSGPRPDPAELDQAPRRPLVRTSLFDRPRHVPGGQAGSTGDAENGRAAAPAAPTASPPSTASTTTASHADDDARAADTLIVPIDDGEGTQAAEGTAPRYRSRSRSSSLSRSDRPAPDPGQASAAIGTYDDLFGETLHRRVEDAAVRRPEQVTARQTEGDAIVTPSAPARPDASTTPASASETPSGDSAAARPALRSQGVDSVTAGPDTVPVSGEPGSTPTGSGTATSPGGDLIDWVPGVGRAAPEISQAAARRPSAPQQPARSGQPSTVQPRTVQPPTEQPRTVQPRTVPSGTGSTPTRPVARPAGTATTPSACSDSSAHGHSTTGAMSATAVLLSGLVCPHGHANSLERMTCGPCGAPLTGTPRTVARPPLGVIELSTGARIVLDRSAILGRRPRASRVSAHDVPQLIAVPSPQQDISRSHLELRLEGWHVVAFDLGTTNGTTLLRENTEPVRLRPREGVVLREGDTIDLGDGVRLRLRERR